MQAYRDKIEADNRIHRSQNRLSCVDTLDRRYFLDSSPGVLFGCKSGNCKTESYENIQTIFGKLTGFAITWDVNYGKEETKAWIRLRLREK